MIYKTGSAVSERVNMELGSPVLRILGTRIILKKMMRNIAMLVQRRQNREKMEAKRIRRKTSSAQLKIGSEFIFKFTFFRFIIGGNLN